MPDAIWSLTQLCWAQQPSDRPSAKEVVLKIAEIAGIPRNVDQPSHDVTALEIAKLSLEPSPPPLDSSSSSSIASAISPSARSPGAPPSKEEVAALLRVVEAMAICPASWVHNPDEGGFRCAEGSHFTTYAEILAFISPNATSASSPSPSAPLPPSEEEVKQMFDKLKKMTSCSGPWVHKPDEGGFRCAEGSHLETYADIRAFVSPTPTRPPSPSPSTPSKEEVTRLLGALQKVEPCSGGYAWVDMPDQGGFICEGGVHFKSYAEAREVVGPTIAASPSAPSNSSAPLPPPKEDVKPTTGAQKVPDLCEGGHPWVDSPDEGGFRCQEGSHFKSYAEARALSAFKAWSEARALSVSRGTPNRGAKDRRQGRRPAAAPPKRR